MTETKTPRKSPADRLLDRVQQILEETCERDGEQFNTQERDRRKSYRAGINRALDEIKAQRG